MRRLVSVGIGVVVVVMMMLTTFVFVLLGGGQVAAACTPTTTSISEGTVTVGTGPASAAYFALFGSGLVLEKKTNAALIIQISRKENLTDYSAAIVIATSLQESGLRNLPYGDRDSLGLFSQRPSAQAWGTAEQIMDPVHATEAFITAMKKNVPSRDSMSMIDVAIATQNPDTFFYYRDWQWDAIATELVKGASLQSCAVGEAHLPLDPGYHVSGSWGSNDPTYPAELKPHKGIDLSNYAGGTSAGRPVYAALSGVVIESGIGRGCSGVNTVTILHDGGFSTGYLHMNGNDITVHVGDHVIAGQQIGKIASCGPSDGPHLHFEVNPRNDKDSWLTAIPRVPKYGSYWSDPVAVMAHFGIDLTP